MNDVITFFSTNWVNIMGIVTGAVSVASMIAAITPTPRDDIFIGKLYKIVDWLALNVGKAKD